MADIEYSTMTTPAIDASSTQKENSSTSSKTSQDSEKLSPREPTQTEHERLVVQSNALTAKSGIEDLGWNLDVKDVKPFMINGVPNDLVWTLMRRFNKQMYHVKIMDTKPSGNLDLNIAEEEEFSPDKLRSNVERLYMTVIIGMWKFVKYMALLRSWNDKLRTSIFCLVYYAAWIYDILLPVLLGFLALLVLSSDFRTLAFPPIPLAIVDPLTGDLQKPKAGMLGSTDSMTGVSERYPGEALEQEASDFVSGIATIGLSSSLGKQPKETDDAVIVGEEETTIPDSSNMAAELADAKADAQGDGGEKSNASGQRFMEDAMWQKMRPVMHILGDVCDMWERMGNALSPTYPFDNAARSRIALVLSTCALSSFFVNSYLVIKASTFLAGLLFFNQPFIFSTIAMFNEKFPNWLESVELRNTLLKDVPTNTQLCATLLRIGEQRNAPLVPPPNESSSDPDFSPETIDPEALPGGTDAAAAALNTTPEKLQDTIAPNETPNLDNNTTPPTMTRMLALQVVGAAKLAAKAGTSVIFSADHLKAATGSEASRQRVGVIPTSSRPPSGPVNFTGRFHGKQGMLSIINNKADSPNEKEKDNSDTMVIFSYTGATAPSEAAGRQQARKMFGVDQYDVENKADKQGLDKDIQKDLVPGYGQHGEANAPAFSIRVGDIREVKKVGGLSWQGKLIVGWAMDRSVADAVAITDAQGREWLITAVEGRDAVFNRLMSIGGQKWESW